MASHYLSVIQVEGQRGPTPATGGGRRQNKETATRNKQEALLIFAALLF
jgi:hypothetical protein